MIKFVSSFSQEGYEIYGKKFLESFTENWEYPIVIYYEDEKPDFEHPLVEYKNLYKVLGCSEFLRGISTIPVFRGIIDEKRNYRYDLFTFCRKMFAQVDAAQDHDGYLFWIDADTEIQAPIPEANLEKMLEGVFMCYMDRPGWHSCASFVGWDTVHPSADVFFNAYFDVHISGKIFLLSEWHDSFILDQMRQVFPMPLRNLAGSLELEDGPVNVFDEVFKGYAVHNKGVKKLADVA